MRPAKVSRVKTVNDVLIMIRLLIVGQRQDLVEAWRPEPDRKILQLVDRDCDLAVVIMPQADILRERFNRFSGIGDTENLSHFLPHVMSHAEVTLHVGADSSIAVRPAQESESVWR